MKIVVAMHHYVEYSIIASVMTIQCIYAEYHFVFQVPKVSISNSGGGNSSRMGTRRVTKKGCYYAILYQYSHYNICLVPGGIDDAQRAL